jgi:hypothetical protein
MIYPVWLSRLFTLCSASLTLAKKAWNAKKVLHFSDFEPCSREKAVKMGTASAISRKNPLLGLIKMPRFAAFGKVFAHHFSY